MVLKDDQQETSSPSEPFSGLFQAAQVMQSFPFTWFVCGGWAIDLYMKRVLRKHKDVDIGIWRRDQLEFAAYLRARGWTLQKASGGRLLPWTPGEILRLPVHVIWCKHATAQPDFIEILLNEVDDTQFLFRRDPDFHSRGRPTGHIRLAPRFDGRAGRPRLRGDRTPHVSVHIATGIRKFVYVFHVSLRRDLAGYGRRGALRVLWMRRQTENCSR